MYIRVIAVGNVKVVVRVESAGIVSSSGRDACTASVPRR
jgi:hypothetical protein